MRILVRVRVLMRCVKRSFFAKNHIWADILLFIPVLMRHNPRVGVEGSPVGGAVWGLIYH